MFDVDSHAYLCYWRGCEIEGEQGGSRGIGNDVCERENVEGAAAGRQKAIPGQDEQHEQVQRQRGQCGEADRSTD